MKNHILAFLLFIIFPIQFGNATSPAVKVDVPIQELQGLLQQLDDISNNLLGQAGIQLRQTIDELNDKVEQQIGNIKDAALEVITEASAQLRLIVEQLIQEANKLLATVNEMINQKIECINQALAERIAQVKDTIAELLDRATEAIQNAVDRIYLRATQLVDTGTSRVATVLDKTVGNMIRIGLGVAVFILLFWLIRTLYKFDKTASNKTLKYVIMGFCVALIGLFTYAIFSKTIVAKIAGEEIILPKWENSCEEGDRLYNKFIEMINAGADKAELKKIGDLALENLNWCLLTSVSPERGRGTTKAINEISAVLYPPPASPASPNNPVATTCPPVGGGGGGAVKPGVAIGWLSKYDLGKLVAYENIRQRKVKVPDLIGPRVNPTDPVMTTYIKDVNKQVYNQQEVIKTDVIIDRKLELKHHEIPTRVLIYQLKGGGF